MRLGERPIEADIKTLRVLLGKCGLAQPGGWVPFAVSNVLPGSGISSSPINVYSATIGRPMLIRSLAIAAYVATTNNGSNYWTIALVETDLTSIASVNTSAISADSWARLSTTGIDTAIATSDIGLFVRATSTGSPGNLYLQSPAIFVT